ncbi:unnamed protein product [Calypogeia fissa]
MLMIHQQQEEEKHSFNSSYLSESFVDEVNAVSVTTRWLIPKKSRTEKHFDNPRTRSFVILRSITLISNNVVVYITFWNWRGIKGR